MKFIIWFFVWYFVDFMFCWLNFKRGIPIKQYELNEEITGDIFEFMIMVIIYYAFIK